jgi:hypothetical protein
MIAPSVPGFRLVPEFAVGAGGGGTSTYLAANAMYEVGPIFRSGRARRLGPACSTSARRSAGATGWRRS